MSQSQNKTTISNEQKKILLENLEVPISTVQRKEKAEVIEIAKYNSSQTVNMGPDTPTKIEPVSYCVQETMSICTARGNGKQVGCEFYEKARFADRCDYYRFNEYCVCLDAQKNALSTPSPVSTLENPQQKYLGLTISFAT